MQTKQQLFPIESYAAYYVAKQLGYALEEANDDFEDLLDNFYEEMAERKQDSYSCLYVVGLGELREAFVWWMDDSSIVIVGWQTQDTVAIAVLPPDAIFTPLPFDDGGTIRLH